MEVPPLAKILAEVADPRQAQGQRHSLEAMLRLAVIALLCGYETIGAIAEWGPHYGEEYRSMLGFARHGWPGRSTWYRVMALIDVADLERKLGTWTEEVLRRWLASTGQEGGISLDGKSLRGSRRQGAVDWHILGAVAHEIGLALGQVGVNEKTNEIGMVEELIASLVVTGRVVTTDALLTQKAVARQIVRARGDYVLPVKGNQPYLQAALHELFLRQTPEGRAEHIEKAHGRLTTRLIETSTGLNEELDWPQLGQVFRITRQTRFADGRVRQETSFGITSLDSQRASPERLLGIVRQHWTIENRSHWVRDVDFNEDRSQLRSGHAPQVMAALRNTAIALIRLDGSFSIATSLRRFAAQPSRPISLVSGAT